MLQVLSGKLSSAAAVVVLSVVLTLPAAVPTVLDPPAQIPEWSYSSSSPTGEPAGELPAPSVTATAFQMLLLDAPVPATCAGLERFRDEGQLREWVRDGQPHWYAFDIDGLGGGNATFTAAVSSVADRSFSNNQVAGVDEADFAKTDGHLLYTRAGSSVAVVRLFPLEEARVLQRLAFDGQLRGLLLDGAHLVLITEAMGVTRLRVYDRTVDPLTLEREVEINGSVRGARAIGDHVFLVTAFALYDFDGPLRLPVLRIDGRERPVAPSDIGYLESSWNASSLVTLLKMNLSSPQDPALTTILADAGSTLYVSESNAYLAGQAGFRWGPGAGTTAILKIPLRRGPVDCAVAGSVEGRLLNQFSLDEYAGNLRVATTIGAVSKANATARNCVVVLSDDLAPVGRLDDLAPGERIYSARFMGERLYLVTFKKVDPLFVIDLANASSPAVMGYLKIPGFSDYLHPVADGWLVGVGKETVEATTGNFAWFQGVKLSLFDVRDVAHPREAAQLVIGERGSWTPVSTDHLAFTWIPERSMLVLPIHVFEVDESQWSGSQPSWAYGREVWQGAYVIRVTEGAGFEVLFQIPGGALAAGGTCSWGWSLPSPGSITRSFAVEPYLVTLSAGRIEVHSLDTGVRALRLELAQPVRCISSGAWVSNDPWD